MSTAIPSSTATPSLTSLAGALSNDTSAAAAASALFAATSDPSTSSSSSDSSSGSNNSLDQLSQQVLALDQQQQQANIKTQDFQKNTNDVQIDNRMTARNVGILRENNSRLNVFSSLDKNDPADFFTFSVSSTAPTKLGMLTDNQQNEADVRVQVLDQSGRVVADSSPDSGDANSAYKQLQAGTYNLQAGKYVLRVSRQDDSHANQQNTFNYAIQMNQGLYQNDFDTIEKSVDTSADPFGFGANSALDTLTSSLAGSVTDLQNLPPIGTSATDKLTGVLTSQLA
jgi:hypothetical protein